MQGDYRQVGLLHNLKWLTKTDAYYYMNLLACYVWAVRVTNKKRLHNLKWLTKLMHISRWIYLLVTMPKLISDVNFFFLKGTRAGTSIGLLQRQQCIQIHQEADGPSILAISRDRTDVRSTECTEPSTAPSGSTWNASGSRTLSLHQRTGASTNKQFVPTTT